MIIQRIPTEILTIKSSLLQNLETFIDYFLDDATKQIIKKYHFEELEIGNKKNQHFQTKIRVIGIKVFIVYQNITKQIYFFKNRVIDIKNNYAQIPIFNIYQTIKNHPITVFSLKSTISVYIFLKKEAKILFELIIHCSKILIDKIRQSKLKAHADQTAKRLKRVIQAAFCYTKQSTMFKKSKQLYNFVENKYSQLKKKFNKVKYQGERISQRVHSKMSYESSVFDSPQKIIKPKVIKVRSNDYLGKKLGKLKPQYCNKKFQIVDQQSSSLQMSQRKPSMSQCGGYSSDCSV